MSKTPKNKFTAIPLTLVSLLGWINSAHAQTVDRIQSISVTDSRLESVEKLPANVTIIDAQDIKESAATNLPELLSQEVGIQISGFYSHGARTSVGIRTFGATASQNTLILLDGRRLNDIDLSTVNFSAIPFENIDRIEIVRGSGAVLYGDGATSGIVNIITKNPNHSKNYHKITGTVGSYSHRELNFFTTQNNEDFGFTLNVNNKNSDGYRDNNAYKGQNAQLDVRVPTSQGEVYAKLSNYHETLGLSGSRSVDPTTNTNELKTDRNGTSTPNDWATQEVDIATVGYSHFLNQTDTVVIDIGSRTKHQRSYLFGGHRNTKIESYSVLPRIHFAQKLGQLNSNWKIGLDLYQHHYHLKDLTSSQADIEQTNQATYAQGLIDLTKTTHLLAGYRTEKVNVKVDDIGNATEKHRQNEAQESYELSIKQVIDDAFSVYVKIDQSVRFGKVDELYSSFSGSYSALKPQVAKGQEVGINFTHSRFNTSLNYFEQQLKNEIHYNSITFQNTNLDNTEHKGYEFSLDAGLTDNLELTANYTNLKATFTEGEYKGNELILIPEHTANVSLSALLPKSYTLGLNWHYSGEKLFGSDFSNSFGDKIPAYHRLDLKVKKDFKQLTFALKVNNLLNKEYFNLAYNSSTTEGKYSAYPMPDRNVYLSVAYQFD